jgi:integrase
MSKTNVRVRNLKELFSEYINECRYAERLRPETIRGYENVFWLFLKIMPEVTTTETLTPQMLKEFFKRIETRIRMVGKGVPVSGVKSSTIKTQHNKLNAFFVWLCKNGYIERDSNPLRDIKRPRVSYEDFKRLEDDDIRRLYSATTLHSNNSFLLRRDTMMISLLLYCGLRKGELAGLQVSDIDMEKRIITVRGETSKSRRTRLLRIHPSLFMHLKDYFKERNIRRMRTPYLIASSREDAGLSYEGLKHWVQGLIRKSDVKFHLHQLRHSFASKLAEEDVEVTKIQKMMGHVDIRMTAKYTRSLRSEDMGDDIGKISI